MKRPRIYADTSVFGGVFDNEFRAPSEGFFEEIRKGRFSLVTSAVVQAEIDPAPQQVKELFEEMLAIAELIDITEEAISLSDAYLEPRSCRQTIRTMPCTLLWPQFPSVR